jgi:hypothetical protein
MKHEDTAPVAGTGAQGMRLAGPVTGKGAGVPAPFPVTPACAVPLCAPVIFSQARYLRRIRFTEGTFRGRMPFPVTARETLSAA